MKVLTLKKNGHVVIEEVPTNNASNGANAGLPPDEPPVRRKKRKNKMGIDIFQRIRNSRIKEQTMENQTTIKEYSSDEKTGSGGGSNEVSATMRFIQQKRKMNKKQEREKRAANRKQEIQQLSKAKAKDYQKKAGDRQKKISKDINKSDKKESFDWQSAFTEVNKRFAELKQEDQEAMLFTWMQLSEDNQKQFLYVLIEDHGVDTLQKFIKDT